MTISYTTPTGWRFPALAEIAPEKGAIRIGPFGSALKKHEYSASGIRVLGIDDVFPNELVSLKPKFIPEKKYKELTQYTVKAGDLLVTNMGTVGRACTVPENFERAIISSHLIKVTFDPTSIVSSYIAWMLNHCPLVVAQVKAKSRGAIMAGFNTGLLKELRIPIPPLSEQKRIAEILDRAECLRAKRRAALAQLDSLTQSIFLDMFGDPAGQSQCFPMQPLGALLKRPLQNGAYYPKELYTDTGGVEMVHMSDAFYEVVPRGKLKRVMCSKSDLDKYALSECDVLIARRSLTLEGAAKPCLIPKSREPLIFESSFIRVTPHPEKIIVLYIYHYLGNERVKRKSIQPYITQSTISGINQSNLERVPVIVPPLPLQHEFAHRAKAVERIKTAQRKSLAELDALFASLQHRAFRGEL